MTKARAVAVFFTVFVAMAALPAAAQSCQEGGRALCGPCGAEYNLIRDGHFYEGCADWSYDSAASRGQFGMSCGTDTYSAKITGPTNGWQSISQYVMADEGGDAFDFGASIEIDDPDTTVEVWVGKHPAVWTQIHSISGVTGCLDVSQLNITGHGWDDEPLLILISANIPDSGKTVKIDRVSFWQKP